MDTSPADWPARFAHHLERGNLEGVMALYEPNARFVTRSGEVVGLDGIRSAVHDLIQRGVRLRPQVTRVVILGALAVLYTDWEGPSPGDEDGPQAERHSALEVLRRRDDGDWGLLFGDPTGRDARRGD